MTYYENLIENKKLDGLKKEMVRDHVNNQFKKYKKAVIWSNQTGQGLKEDGPAAFKSIYKIKEKIISYLGYIFSILN
jgi:hypothetical protein